MKRDNLPINEPCHADWSAMDGDRQKRFCGECSKHVHNLSAMTEPEAKAVLTTVEQPCVRYTCNPDGTIRFRPTSRRVFLARTGMVAGGLMIGGLPAAASVAPIESGEACGSKSLFDRLSEAFWSLFEEPEPVLMGEPAIAEPIVPEEHEVLMGDVLYEEPEPIEMLGQPVVQPEMGGISLPPKTEE